MIISPAFLEALSIALRRADCSQAWPSARPQKMALAKAYSRRLGRSSSSVSKAEMFSVIEVSLHVQSHFVPLGSFLDVRDAMIASSEKASMVEGS